MKSKNYYFLFLLAVFLFLFTSCTGSTPVSSVSAAELVKASVAGYESADVPDSLLFVRGAAEDSANYLDSETAGLYFKGIYGADMTVFDSLADYAIHIPNTKRVFEIDILVTHSPDELVAAADLLESRLTVKNNGDIQNYTPAEVPLLESAEIFTTGNYAVLLATPDNSVARGIIDNLLYSETTAPESVDVTEQTSSYDLHEFTSVTEIDPDDRIENTDTETADSARSEIPDITVVMHNENRRVLIGGTCAADAVIHMRGGVEDLTYRPDDGNFLGNIEIPSTGSALIHVTAEQPGLAESEPYEISVKERTDVDLINRMGAYHHIIGADYQGFVVDEINDRTGANVFTDKQTESVKKRIAERVDFLNGIGCELIYFIIPTPMHVYPELVPERFPLNTGITRTEQFETAAAEAGAKVINLFDLFSEHKNDEFKIFHKTDTHWTQYGAFLGYRSLMSYVSQKWPEAAGRRPDEVEFYKKQVEIADLAEHTTMDQSLLRENATFMRLLFETKYDPEIFHPRTNRLTHDLCSQDHITTSSQTELQLPRAYVMRDSFGTPIYSLISDAFSSVHWKAMWSYDFDKKDITSFKPDYVIYVITERNIGNIIG